MQKKKTASANLENKRLPLFFLGIMCACALVLTAFEWRTYALEDTIPACELEVNCLPDETILASFPKKPEIPKPKPRQEAEIFVLVEELLTTEEQLFFPNLDLLVPEVQEIGFEMEIVDEDSLYITVEEMPEFPGGLEAMYKYLQENIKFPQKAKDAGVAGKVHLAFVVGKQGEITQVEVQSGIGWGLDQEAVRVVNAMPAWKPGKQRGIPVNVRYNLPIKYTLAR